MTQSVIYLTRKNSDMTEGRGPMVNDKAFSTREDADDYIDRQPGVMGRKAKWSTEEFGDWKVEIVPVYDTVEDAIMATTTNEKNAALKLLSPYQRQLLGLPDKY